MDLKNRIIIGLTEEVLIKGKKKKRRIIARIDTGATKSSIDKALAKELELGPVLRNKVIKSAHGSTKRPIVAVKTRLAGRSLNCHFTIADRSHMKYKVLIGQNILTRGFLIDPLKK
jgi:hypothetical protein